MYIDIAQKLTAVKQTESLKVEKSKDIVVVLVWVSAWMVVIVVRWVVCMSERF